MGDPQVLSRADAAWLNMESATNHFVVTSVALLDGRLDVGRLKAVIERRLPLHPRLRGVLAGPRLPLAPPRLRADTGFDVHAHVQHVGLAPPADRAALAAFIGNLAGRPLDFQRPLWEIYAVEGLPEGTALVTRIHHSLGDGQALVRLLLAMTDAEPGGWRTLPHSRARRRRPPSADVLGRMASLAGTVLAAPSLARTGVAGAGTLARLTLLDADRRTPLKGALGRVKRVAWSESVDLEFVKRVARATETTINDVVVSTIAGALGDHLLARGASTDGLRLRAMVPVDLRPPGEVEAFGNRFSLIYLELPVGMRHPLARLMRVKIEMDRIKDSLEPAVAWLMLQSMGLLPARLESVAAGFYADKATLVLTNVRGPAHPLYLAGRRIREMAFWEPESGGLGLGLSVFSYAGRLNVGAIADARLVSDPASITAGFSGHLAGLAEAAAVRMPGRSGRKGPGRAPAS
jgi:diacylglycerol O-acyltransferase / wax synthase